MRKKYWLVYEVEDKYTHRCCYVRPLEENTNIAAVLHNITGVKFANVLLTKKAAVNWADARNRQFIRDGEYIYDFDENGKDPAPFRTTEF